jgi:hypothetical protein
MSLKVALNEDGYYEFNCPHCDDCIQVKKTDVACGIFRHGVVKATGLQVPPHSSESSCKELVRTQAIYGCGRPFKFDGETLEICGWI